MIKEDVSWKIDNIVYPMENALNKKVIFFIYFYYWYHQWEITEENNLTHPETSRSITAPLVFSVLSLF